jgi:hypothetical protein
LKNKDLKTYASLARIGFPKSFSGKIMLVLFAGTHLPLLALVLYLLLAPPGGLGTHLGVLVALLIATLLGFVATLFALRALLAPVRLASSSLEAYLHDRRKHSIIWMPRSARLKGSLAPTTLPGCPTAAGARSAWARIMQGRNVAWRSSRWRWWTSTTSRP